MFIEHIFLLHQELFVSALLINWNVSNIDIDYLVVAGGGGGGDVLMWWWWWCWWIKNKLNIQMSQCTTASAFQYPVTRILYSCWWWWCWWQGWWISNYTDAQEEVLDPPRVLDPSYLHNQTGGGGGGW